MTKKNAASLKPRLEDVFVFHLLYLCPMLIQTTIFMKDLYRKYVPEEVFLFYFKRELTPEEKDRGIVLNEYGNVPTGIEFLDCFAGLVRRFGRQQQDVYAKAIGVEKRALVQTVHTLSGRTFDEWIDYHLFFGAYEILKKPRTKIYEASKKLGFSQPSVFSKYFKSRIGWSPEDILPSLRSGKRNTDEIAGKLAKFYK